MCRIREAKKASTAVIDVDGSYLFRKYEQCGDSNMLPVPNAPLAGWDIVSQENYSNIAKNIPTVTHGKSRVVFGTNLSLLITTLCHLGLLYTYLAEGTGNSSDKGGAFRALQRGFVHWSSGRLQHLEVNYKNPLYCHVRCQMTPSMKLGQYSVYVLLSRDGPFASIQCASCQCAAG